MPFKEITEEAFSGVSRVIFHEKDIYLLIKDLVHPVISACSSRVSSTREKTLHAAHILFKMIAVYLNLRH